MLDRRPIGLRKGEGSPWRKMRAQVLRMTVMVLNLPSETLGRSEAELEDLLRPGMEPELLVWSSWEPSRVVVSSGSRSTLFSWADALVVEVAAIFNKYAVCVSAQVS